MQVLFSMERLSILINDDMDAVIMSENFEVLEKMCFEEYYRPSAQQLLETVDKTARKYFKIDEKDAPFKVVSLHLYNIFIKQFKESDFYKDYKNYQNEEGEEYE